MIVYLIGGQIDCHKIQELMFGYALTVSVKDDKILTRGEQKFEFGGFTYE